MKGFLISCLFFAISIPNGKAHELFSRCPANWNRQLLHVFRKSFCMRCVRFVTFGTLTVPMIHPMMCSRIARDLQELVRHCRNRALQGLHLQTKHVHVTVPGALQQHHDTDGTTKTVLNHGVRIHVMPIIMILMHCVQHQTSIFRTNLGVKKNFPCSFFSHVLRHDLGGKQTINGAFMFTEIME
jgi:hypothetical protein